VVLVEGRDDDEGLVWLVPGRDAKGVFCGTGKGGGEGVLAVIVRGFTGSLLFTQDPIRLACKNVGYALRSLRCEDGVSRTLEVVVYAVIRVGIDRIALIER
jgi:hypothetical protein